MQVSLSFNSFPVASLKRDLLFDAATDGLSILSQLHRIKERVFRAFMTAKTFNSFPVASQRVDPGDG
ncbi:MAG: hypothetical protein NZ954_08695 [Thermofilaceae archaeon]|nr:hypothetical protein [Thermofilaceae archaeon]